MSSQANVKGKRGKKRGKKIKVGESGLKRKKKHVPHDYRIGIQDNDI